MSVHHELGALPAGGNAPFEEFSPLPPPPEAIVEPGEAFRARAHHVALLAELEAGGDMDEIQERVQVNAAAQDQAARLPGYDWRAKNAPHLLTAAEKEPYKPDVFGPDDESAEVFKGEARQYAQEYIDLPPDAPIEILENMPDPVCNACAVGKHCGEWIREDTVYIGALRAVAEAQGVGAAISEKDTETTMNDGSVRQVAILRMSKATFQELIADEHFAGLVSRVKVQRTLAHLAIRSRIKAARTASVV